MQPTILEQAGTFLFKPIPTGAKLPILRGPLKGMMWIVGAGAGAGKGISTILNLSEPKQMSIALRLAQRSGICFDIGANVGQYTLLFARYSRRVYSFEPLPRNIRYLSETLESNNIRNAVIVPMAVSDTTKLSYFKEGANCALGRLDSSEGLPVVSVSCDDFASFFHVVPSLMKIDVEGGEMAVLRGAKKLLLEHKPSVLLSTHGSELREECLRFLRKLDYQSVQPIDVADADRATEFAVGP